MESAEWNSDAFDGRDNHDGYRMMKSARWNLLNGMQTPLMAVTITTATTAMAATTSTTATIATIATRNTMATA